MKIEPKDLENSGYILFEQLKHSELLVFISEKSKSKGIFFYLFLLSVIIPIPILSFTLTLNIMTNSIGWVDGLLYSLLGVGLAMIFTPVHELLHALAYKIVGARNISFYSNFKKFYFATISNKSVVNLRAFKIVAFFPFLTVVIISILLFPYVIITWKIVILSFVATHNLFCSGDFTLSNYMQNNRHRGIVTYDDTEKEETYFYIRKE